MNQELSACIDGPQTTRSGRGLRIWIAATLAGLFAWSAASAGESIRDVLERSQQMQLDTLLADQIPTDDPRIKVIGATLDRVLAVTPATRLNGPLRLLVVNSGIVALCTHTEDGPTIVVNAVIAELTEAERTFILAHEVGHVAAGHWYQLTRLYEHHIPGEVVREKTDGVAAQLGADASRLMHTHEFEADAFAMRALRRLGDSDGAPIALLREHLPLVRTTPTHPGTQARVQALQAAFSVPTK